MVQFSVLLWDFSLGDNYAMVCTELFLWFSGTRGCGAGLIPIDGRNFGKCVESVSTEHLVEFQ